MADWTTTRLNLRYHWKAVFLWGVVIVGLLIGGLAHAHNFDPDDFQPTGTTQRTLEYDPLHPLSAGTISTTSTGFQPLVGAYTCEGTNTFEVRGFDTVSFSFFQEHFPGCAGIGLRYVYPNEDMQCQVAGTDLTFTLTVEQAHACFPSLDDCFVYDESLSAYLPKSGCVYQAAYTSVLTDEKAGLRAITRVTEEITYTSATWDAGRQRVNATLSGTLTGEVKRIDLDFSPADNNRRATLENPAPNTHVSGIGQITGWACSDLDLEVQIHDDYSVLLARFPVPHGISRADTASVCGDTLNGFSAVYNWNLLPPDINKITVHLVQQGQTIATAPVQVVPFEQEFIRGASGSAVVQNFPMPGESVVVEWVESLQNFVIMERR